MATGLPLWAQVRTLPGVAASRISLLCLGDRLGTDQFPSLLCAYQNEDYLFHILEKKFPRNGTLVLVHPASYTPEGFGIYSQFLERASKNGDPLGYHPQKRKASLCVQERVSDLLELEGGNGSSVVDNDARAGGAKNLRRRGRRDKLQ